MAIAGRFQVVKKTAACLVGFLIYYNYVRNNRSFSSSLTSPLPHASSSSSSPYKDYHDYLRRNSHHSKAYDQSYGFFTDVSNNDWEQYQRRYTTQERHANGDIRNNKNHIDSGQIDWTNEQEEVEKADDQSKAHLFYQNNYDAEFTCLNQEKIGIHRGGNGHDDITNTSPKWLCDPHRIIPASRKRKEQNGNGCLVYLFAEKQDPTSFVQELDYVLLHECDIHVFSSEKIEWIDHFAKKIGSGFIISSDYDKVHLHAWGLEGQAEAEKFGRQNYLTFDETLAELKHEGRTIDVLSIDCDGCEWSIYADVLNSDAHITQLLIELHKAPYQVNDFFLEMRRNNYVISHKEADPLGGGQIQEYSFLKLAPEFFET